MNARTAKKGVRLPDDQPAQQPADAEPEQQERLDKTSKDVTELNNIAGSTANTVGQEREEIVRAQAIADAARRGQKADLAPAAAIGGEAEPSTVKRKALINGKRVEVDVQTIRRNSAVEQFGPEVSYPKGTRIRKDGKPCEGNDEAVGVVADINTAEGKLVNRVVMFDQLEAAE